MMANLKCISVRDEFSLGGGGAKVYCLNIFSIACRQISSGFARILPDFLPEKGYLKNYRRAAAPSAPWAVRLCLNVLKSLLLCNI